MDKKDSKGKSKRLPRKVKTTSVDKVINSAPSKEAVVNTSQKTTISKKSVASETKINQGLYIDEKNYRKIESWCKYLKKVDPIRYKNTSILADALFKDEIERIKSTPELWEHVKDI